MSARLRCRALVWLLVLGACAAKRGAALRDAAPQADAATAAVASPAEPPRPAAEAEAATTVAPVDRAPVEATLAELLVQLDSHEAALRDAGVRLGSYRKAGVSDHPRRTPSRAPAGKPSKPAADTDAREQACSNVCDLAETMCGLSERICALARDHVDEKEYGDACERAQRDCERAEEACEGCEG